MTALSCRKIDVHMHVPGSGRRYGFSNEDAIAAADRLNIAEMWCSTPVSGNRVPDPAEVRACNESTWYAVKAFPDRIRGYAYINPGYPREALDEARYWLEQGMIGLKFYHQYLADEPVLFPLYELAIEYGVPLLWHAGRTWQNKLHSDQPRITDAGNLVAASRRYPEAMFIEGHIGGGGDWEWTLRELPYAPGVFLDTSGTVIDDGIIDRCVEAIGVERLLFATDMTMEGGVAKVMDADLTDAQLEAICFRNAEAILARRRQ